MRPISKQIAWLCLLLMLSSAIAFVAHQHSDEKESVRCTLCVAAHSASPTAPAVLLRATFAAISIFHPEPVASAKQRLIAFALSVRPPPEI